MLNSLELTLTKLSSDLHICAMFVAHTHAHHLFSGVQLSNSSLRKAAMGYGVCGKAKVYLSLAILSITLCHSKVKRC